MNVVIIGGTGQVGTILARNFLASGDEVVVVGRSVSQADWRTVRWDAATHGEWSATIDGADVVINLAGRSVDCRYNEKNRRLIMDSRVDTTRLVGQAIERAASPPKVWLQASTATIYSHRYDAPNDELTGKIGGDEPDAASHWKFGPEVAIAWEAAASEFQLPATRTVMMRMAMVMSPDRGGIFDTILGLVRKGLGGKNASGKQYVSWIHEHDYVRAVRWIIEHPDLTGPINLAAPEPLPNAEFMRAIREAWGIRIGLPAMKWMLEIGAIFMRTETELILKSRRVVPTLLLQSGFEFRYPDWPSAANELCQRARES